jgi:hypothetical protein
MSGSLNTKFPNFWGPNAIELHSEFPALNRINVQG